MWEKANELICKEQRPAQSKVWNIENIYDKLYFDDILLT